MNTSLERFYIKVFDLGNELSDSFISKVAHSVSEALFFLKQKKMIHRDIKPSNILLNYTGEIKLCDLGLSGFTTNSVCNTSDKGCRNYMAVIMRKMNTLKKLNNLISQKKIDVSITGGCYSIKSDIWSFGISLVIYKLYLKKF